MIVLDTNVVAELTRPGARRTVVDRVDEQDASQLVITAVTAAEIRAGVALLPQGRRRREVGQRMEALITETFAGHVLAFDVRSSQQYATQHYGTILATRTRAGRPSSGLNAQTAAVCAQHEATLATGNTADFDGVGLTLVNPWQPPTTGTSGRDL